MVYSRMNNIMKPPIYYPIAIRLAMPIYRQMVKKKSRHLPTLDRELNERFGEHYQPVPNSSSQIIVDKAVDKSVSDAINQDLSRGVIWCHAVSLGELNTAYPLLKKLINQGFKLWITSTTQTGFNRVSQLFADKLGVVVNHSFVPVDNLAVVQRFINHVRPVMAIFIETELWATMLHELSQQGIPSVMVNARLTQKSYEGYVRFGKLSRSMMANLSAIIAQDEESAKRFRQLGASDDKVVVIDSLKWSSFGQLDDKHDELAAEANTWQLIDHKDGRRPIWIAASTHEGEERLVLQVYQKLMAMNASVLLILVPRHPERFDEVARLCDEMGFNTKRRSKNDTIHYDTQVYLADSMGELLGWYQVADVALVAGSLVDKGGHNPIEPASLGRPVVMGRFTKNCEILVQELSGVGALVQTDDSVDDIAKALSKWLFDKDLAAKAGQAGRDLVMDKQHAADKQTQVLLDILAGVR
ncbi:hypothetical protein MOVS_07475 [Moraxella ovis]|uniref:3-deoxy-D-manno-octulosonic acid transferase n=3 Tax=Moraxella ovis TaxID=29433 RepID=A0ABM6BDS1_9GAMM|nr:hypothetical protein MOVS_07475 [Moraxella ovis]